MIARWTSRRSILLGPVLLDRRGVGGGVPGGGADPDDRRGRPRGRLLARLPAQDPHGQVARHRRPRRRPRRARRQRQGGRAAVLRRQLRQVQRHGDGARASTSSSTTTSTSSRSPPRPTMPTCFMRVFGHDDHERLGAQRHRARDHRHGAGARHGQHRLDVDSDTDRLPAPFEAMQNAALDLVDIIYGDEDEIDNVWVSLVPYVADGEHRPQPGPAGSAATGDQVLDAAALTQLPPSATGGGWKGCVMARAYPWDTDDIRRPRRTRSPRSSTPTTQHRRQQLADDQRQHRRPRAPTRRDTASGPNLGCGTPITPLTPRRRRSRPGSTR